MRFRTPREVARYDVKRLIRLEHVAFNCIHTLRPESSLSILGL